MRALGSLGSMVGGTDKAIGEYGDVQQRRVMEGKVTNIEMDVLEGQSNDNERAWLT